MEMECMIVIEKAPRNHAAHVPDLPVRVIADATRDDETREAGAAIVRNIESLREAGHPVPAPQCAPAVMQVAG